MAGCCQVKEASSKSALGALLGTFRGYPIDASTWIFFFLPGAILFVLLMLTGSYLAVISFQHHGPALAIYRSQAWFLLAGLLFLILAAYLAYRVAISRQRIRAFENGLELRDFFFRTRSFRWTDLSGISLSATRLTLFGKAVSTRPVCKVFPKLGKTTELSSKIQGLPELIQIIKTHVYPLIWPGIKSDVRAGRAASFGTITISNEGLSTSKGLIPWEKIARLNTVSGFLVVELHDDSTRKVAAIDIVNLELLLEAVEWGFQ